MAVVDNTKLNQTLVVEDIRTVKKIRRPSFAWIVWGVSMLFVLFQFFLQLSSGEIINGLMRDFSVSAFGGGILASAYYYVYVALQTPAGLMVDRFGTKRLLTIGAMVCAVGSFIFSTSHHLFIAALGRLMMGGGAAFAFVGSLNLVAKWFPIHRFVFMTAVAEAVGMLGGIMGGIFLAALVQQFGWRHSIMGASMVAAIIATLIWTVVRDTPNNTTPVLKRPKGALLRDLKTLVNSKIAWINGAYSGIMFSIVTVFVALWGIPFMMLAYHISLTMATFVCNLVFAGVALGSPLLAWLDMRLNCRRRLLIICALVSALLLSLLIYFPVLPLWVVMILMTVLGLFASSYIITFGVGNEIVAPHMRGTSIGFVNTLSMITAPLLQPFVGLVLEIVTEHSGGIVGKYTVSEYQVALTIIPVLVLLAAWLARFIPSRR